MTSAEIFQLIIAIAAAAFAYWRWVLSQNDREQRRAWKERGSRTYDVTQTGSLFVPRFDRYVQKNATIYIPAGDGLYARRIKTERAANYKSGLRNWLAKGANVNIIVSSPNQAAYDEWRPLKETFPRTLNIYFLHREKASGLGQAQTKAQIATLDTFHPAILLRPGNSDMPRGVMWIEHLHPLESKYAYRVEFIDPADPVDAAANERLDTYKRTFEDLLKGPHVEVFNPTKAAPAAGRGFDHIDG